MWLHIGLVEYQDEGEFSFVKDARSNLKVSGSEEGVVNMVYLQA